MSTSTTQYSVYDTSSKHPLKIYYGSMETNTDITPVVFSKCLVSNYLVIPPDDDFRSKLFGDPCFSVVKQVIIFGIYDSLVFVPSTMGILIDMRTFEVIRDAGLVRKYVHRMAPQKEKLSWIHRLLSIDYGSMMEEFPEQKMAIEYLTGNEKVLEIGANIGRNSLVIAAILNNDENLVCLECSPAISRQLAHNRDKNAARFHIETAALSERRLFQQGWLTVPAESCPDGHTEVPTITYKALMNKYNIEFDTLVLDCEGAFYYILKDMPEIVRHVRTIIVENDYRDATHKEWVDEQLISRGFRVVFQDYGNEEAKRLRMPCFQNFYEVWQLDEECLERSAGEIIQDEGVAEPAAAGAGAMVDMSILDIPTHFTPIRINFMKKYPCVYFLRHDRYSAIDTKFLDVSNSLNCAVIIINPDHVSELKNMVDPNYPILVTYGEDEREYHALVYRHIVSRMNRRWIHMKNIDSIKKFEQGVNYCYINNVIMNRVMTRPVFSIFTTCYKSFDKIERAYSSIQSQRQRDWEWIILDDSPSDDHFGFLRRRFALDPRIRLYRRSENSGNIGNVKNEAVSLCRGKYILEMDHDDEILPDTLSDATRTFEEDPSVGFVYMDFINIYPSGKNFHYGDFISLGYGGYYNMKFRGRWAFVYMTPNINNITSSHIVSVPNHPRIWRADVLYRLGNYSEFLPICDDLEILMRTIINTKMARIPKMAYVQYMNENNNNFSLIRNGEINRLTPYFISPQFYEMYKVHDKMKEFGAYEDEKYLREHKQIWMRDDYTPKFCNKVVQYDYDKQYCIVGIESFYANLSFIEKEYKNPRNDFFLITGSGNREELWKLLDEHGFERISCYSLKNTKPKYLIQYFLFLYRSCEKYEILDVGGSEVGRAGVAVKTAVATATETKEMEDVDVEGRGGAEETSYEKNTKLLNSVVDSSTAANERSVPIPITEVDSEVDSDDAIGEN